MKFYRILQHLGSIQKQSMTALWFGFLSSKMQVVTILFPMLIFKIKIGESNLLTPVVI